MKNDTLNFLTYLECHDSNDEECKEENKGIDIYCI